MGVVPSESLRIAATERGERILTAGATAASMLVLLVECRSVRAQIDDAYISYRYAMNWVDGLGLVYNAGEYVEGQTNLLWTLLVALGLELGLDAEQAGHWLGVGAGMALLGATAAYAWALLPAGRRALAGLAPWIVLAHPSLVVWSESGMETILFAAAATAALALEIRGRSLAAIVACMAATATRPEGVLLAAIVLLPRLLADRRAGRRAWLPAAVYALGLVALTTFRLLYYGSPVPNTYYAKVTPDPMYRLGARSVLDFLAGGVFLLLPGALVSAVGDRRGWPGAAWAFFSLGYLVSIGGDTIGPTRFLVQSLPVLATLALAGTVSAFAYRRWAGVVSIGLLAAACAWQALPAPPSREDGVWRAAARTRTIRTVRRMRHRLRAIARVQVREIEAIEPPVRSIAASGIGYLGYASRLPLIDLLGLTDATIARTPLRPSLGSIPLPGHRRSNADYVLSRRPDVIVLGSPLVPAHGDLLAHPDFERLYCWDPNVRVYRRADLAGSGEGTAGGPCAAEPGSAASSDGGPGPAGSPPRR